jgi:hypothetical protein
MYHSLCSTISEMSGDRERTQEGEKCGTPNHDSPREAFGRWEEITESKTKTLTDYFKNTTIKEGILTH